MTWILWLFLLLVTPAHAQCNGTFGAGQICGNPLSTSAPPRPMAATPGIGTNVAIKCDSSTDNSVAINAAIATLPAAGNNTINLVPSGSGTCNLGNTVLINGIPNVHIVASGYGGSTHNVGNATTQCVLSFLWTGSAGGTMFKWTTNANGPTAQVLVGGGLEGICLDGNSNSANIGLNIVSLRMGVFAHLYLQNFASAAVLLDVINNTGSLMGEPCDTQSNSFQQIYINQLLGSGVGLQTNSYQNAGIGNGGCNISANNFNTIRIDYANHTGILETGSDNNRWYNIQMFAANGGAADCVGSDPCGWDFSISTNGPGTPQPTNSEYIYGATIPTSKLRGAASFPSNTPVNGITIYGLDKGNGSADPILETGATGQWYDSNGLVVNAQYAAPIVVSNNQLRTAGANTYVDVQVADSSGGQRIRIADIMATGAGAPGAFPGFESIGARGDSNQSFGGRLAAAFRRTDGTSISSGTQIGSVLFGGQWGSTTTYSQAQLLYPASVQGIAEGNFTSAFVMPTGVRFNTGSIGQDFGTPNNTFGTERMRITSTGGVNIGPFSSDPGSSNLNVTGSATIGSSLSINTSNVVALIVGNGAIGGSNSPTALQLDQTFANTCGNITQDKIYLLGGAGQYGIGVCTNEVFFGSAGSFAFYSNGSLLDTIQTSGGLSIGTSTDPGAGNIIATVMMLGATDTGISRDSAAVIDFGNGTATNSSATLRMSSFTIGGTPSWDNFSTGAGTQTFTNSPCSALTTERWIKVKFTGSTSTFFIPACS